MSKNAAKIMSQIQNIPGEEKKPKGIGPINPPAAISTLPLNAPEKAEIIMNIIPRKSNTSPIGRNGKAIFFFFILHFMHAYLA